MTEDESSQRLRQLLRLKRHESPPPGFFRDFPGAVVERIQALEAERSIPMWRRWWFREASSVPGVSEEPVGFRLLWVGGAVGALVVAVVMGGLHRGGLPSDPDDSAGGLARTGAPGHSAAGDAFLSPKGLREPTSALAGIDPAWRGAGQGVPSAADPRWTTGIAWPVSVSMASSGSAMTPELSSTNPLPAGLFRLPGSGLPGSAGGTGPEVYRVRFGDGPR